MQHMMDATARYGALTFSPTSLAAVTFRLSKGCAADVVEVAGDFSAWAPIAMGRDADDGFTLDLRLEAGRRWRYRFLLDGERWMNDPDATEFVIAPDGAAISVLQT